MRVSHRPVRFRADRHNTSVRTDPTAPSKTSNLRSSVTMVALRTIVDIKRASHVARFSGHGGVAALRRFIESCAVSAPRRTAISSARMLTAISAGVTAPISNPIGACTPSRHSAACLPQQRVVDARDLRAAADQSEIAEIRVRERAHRVEVVLMAARDDHYECAGGNVGAVQPFGNRSTTTSAPGKRSALANFSRSSMTCSGNPASPAIRAR